MITAALLPAPILKMSASLLTKSFSCLYCGSSILRDESITNTTSRSLSHRTGSAVVGVVMIGVDVVVALVVFGVVFVVFAVVLLIAPGGSFREKNYIITLLYYS